MTDTLLAALRRSADPEDRRMASLLAPLAPGAGPLPMPPAGEALTGFLVSALGEAAPAPLGGPDPTEPALVVQLVPRPARRNAPRARRRLLRPAALAAAAALVVGTAVGAAALAGLGGRDDGVVVTPAVTTPHPAGTAPAPADPAAHPRPAGDGSTAGAAAHDRAGHREGGSTPPAAVLPGPGPTEPTADAEQHAPSAASPSPRDTEGGDGSGGGDGTSGGDGGSSGEDGSATPSPTPTPTDGVPDGSGGTDD